MKNRNVSLCPILYCVVVQSDAFSSGSLFKSLVSTNSTTPAVSRVKVFSVGIKLVVALGAIEKPKRRVSHQAHQVGVQPTDGAHRVDFLAFHPPTVLLGLLWIEQQHRVDSRPFSVGGLDCLSIA